MDDSLKQKLRAVKLLISDIDGVMTDGAIYKNDNGDEYKKFSVLDGTGVALAHSANLIVALISGRYSMASEIRAKELHIKDLYNGTLEKVEPFLELKNKYNLDDEEIAYIGDDIIDLPVMEKIGVPIAVANAVDLVKKIALYTTAKKGGDGALREAIDWMLKGQDRFEETLKIVEEKHYVTKK